VQGAKQSLPTGGGTYQQANFQQKRLRKSKFLIVQGEIYRIIDAVERKSCFLRVYLGNVRERRSNAMPTVEELFAAMPASFQKDAAAGMNAVYQYDITGDGGGKWYAAIKEGELEVVKGEHENPNITLTMADEDYLAMIAGTLDGQAAFMTGKLKIKGDMSLAMKLGSIFK